MPETRPTHELLNGKREAAEKTLYERDEKKLHSYARHRWQMDEDAAWVMVYITLFRVLETHSGYRFLSEEKFAAFVFTVFINYLRNYHRDHKKDSQTVPLDESHHANPLPEETVSSVEMNLLKEALDKMEDWERMLLLLRSQKVPYCEIEKLTGKPESQLKVNYMRLKKRLAQKINEQLTELNAANHGKTG
jgi:RNA polymerase sigma factor (sigma-70 family)